MSGPRPGATVRRLGAAVLGMEAIVAAMAVAPAIVLADVAPGAAVGGGLGLAALCIVAAGLLRRRAGVVLGSVAQVLLVAGWLVLPALGFLGVLFAVLWVVVLRLGARLDTDRAAPGDVGEPSP